MNQYRIRVHKYKLSDITPKNEGFSPCFLYFTFKKNNQENNTSNFFIFENIRTYYIVQKAS